MSESMVQSRILAVMGFSEYLRAAAGSGGHKNSLNTKKFHLNCEIFETPTHCTNGAGIVTQKSRYSSVLAVQNVGSVSTEVL